MYSRGKGEKKDMESVRTNYKNNLANREFLEDYNTIYNSFIVGAVTAAQW